MSRKRATARPRSSRFDYGNFDLVFLDYNMPGLNGLETLERVLARDSGTKVIMISAERDDEHVREAEKLGATAFLYKPFFRADVDRALHRALGLKMPGLATRARRITPSSACWSARRSRRRKRPSSSTWRLARLGSDGESDFVAIAEVAKETVREPISPRARLRVTAPALLRT